jgi:hypothetical protein
VRVGTMFLGHIERIGSEFIATKFFILGIPLLPLESYYGTSETYGGITGFKISLQPTSVLLGYVRILLFTAVFTLGIAGYIQESIGFIIGAGIFAIAWIIAAFVLGKIPKHEQPKRIILKRYTGLYANPAILPDYLKQKISVSLKQQWEELTDRTWDDRLDPNQISNLEFKQLAYTLARYCELEKLAKSLWEKISA